LAGGLLSAPAKPAAGPQATTTAAAPQPASQPTVIVTDEQIARAIWGVLMRSEARNGRLVMVR